MEIYVPRRVLREVRREYKAKVIPSWRWVVSAYYRADPLDRTGIRNKSQFRDRILYGSMNNFHAYIPDPENPKGFSGKKLQAIDTDVMDITFREYFERRGHMRWITDLGVAYSPLALGQTGTEFFQTIDDVVTHYKVDTAEISRLKRTSFLKEAPMIKMGRMIFPVFIHLLALGYGENELKA